MIAIMQPYYLPFIGYFQLINKVDKFIVFDDVKFEKSGYFTSNKIKNSNLILFIKNRNKVSIIKEKLLAPEMKNYVNKLKKILLKIMLFLMKIYLINYFKFQKILTILILYLVKLSMYANY